MTTTPPNQYTIRFILGDYSDDGHCQKEKFVLQTNASSDEIESSLTNFSKYSRVSLSALCDDYEEDYIDGRDLVRVLVQTTTDRQRETLLGCVHLDDEDADLSDMDALYGRLSGEGPLQFAGTEQYLTFLMTCVEIDRPYFKWSIIVPKYDGTIRGFGYGLFP
jgi:hypothetical protein